MYPDRWARNFTEWNMRDGPRSTGRPKCRKKVGERGGLCPAVRFTAPGSHADVSGRRFLFEIIVVDCSCIFLCRKSVNNFIFF